MQHRDTSLSHLETGTQPRPSQSAYSIFLALIGSRKGTCLRPGQWESVLGYCWNIRKEKLPFHWRRTPGPVGKTVCLKPHWAWWRSLNSPFSLSLPSWYKPKNASRPPFVYSYLGFFMVIVKLKKIWGPTTPYSLSLRLFLNYKGLWWRHRAEGLCSLRFCGVSYVIHGFPSGLNGKALWILYSVSWSRWHQQGRHQLHAPTPPRVR